MTLLFLVLLLPAKFFFSSSKRVKSKLIAAFSDFLMNSRKWIRNSFVLNEDADGLCNQNIDLEDQSQFLIHSLTFRFELLSWLQATVQTLLLVYVYTLLRYLQADFS